MIDANSFLTEIDLRFLIGFIFVLGSGFLIGFERGSKGEPAGVRTHSLVAFGSMVFTTISLYVEPSYTGRIAANIVTGVGFICAGIIMQRQGSIHGLTTAASLWFSAAVGMAVGFGFYVIALVSTLFAFFLLKLPHIGEHGVPTYEPLKSVDMILKKSDLKVKKRKK
jgi:putative Mg2+ transporter-C (MgtC) family protein